ncbi:F0F1 ATP synthase subunit epsilon [Actinomyces gerencseriae]|uniref:F0F1 ATP synthase subunit epsilon n=1 Tax=Actinomyces gerencseriae TaxID=52769 RepID=UPI00040155EE|nr:ATP synthase subunit delta [Actinomyces gerencseriae]
MAGPLTVEVVSRFGGEAWSGRAGRVTVPLVDGELGVLPGRQPILAIVGRGAVRIVPSEDGAGEGEAVTVPVAGGFCSVNHDVVTVAADAAGDDAVGSVPAEVEDVPDIPYVED